MYRVLEVIFPKKVDNSIRGSRIPVYVFIVYSFVSLARSLIHTFAPDGGAGSIAGMDLSVEGADGIIFAFALWGSHQLLYAFIQLLVAFRYRSLIPLMYALLVVEVGLRMMVGYMKPVTFAHAPPGAIGNYIFIVLAVAMFILIFRENKRAGTKK
jgi:hypothetical protein